MAAAFNPTHANPHVAGSVQSVAVVDGVSMSRYEISRPGIGSSNDAGKATQHLAAMVVFRTIDIATQVADTARGLADAFNASDACGRKVGAAVVVRVGRAVIATAHNVRTGRASASGTAYGFVHAGMSANISAADIDDAVMFDSADGYDAWRAAAAVINSGAVMVDFDDDGTGADPAGTA